MFLFSQNVYVNSLKLIKLYRIVQSKYTPSLLFRVPRIPVIYIYCTRVRIVSIRRLAVTVKYLPYFSIEIQMACKSFVSFCLQPNLWFEGKWLIFLKALFSFTAKWETGHSELLVHRRYIISCSIIFNVHPNYHCTPSASASDRRLC